MIGSTEVDTVFFVTKIRGGSRLVGRGVSVSRSHVVLLTEGGGTTHVSFYLQNG